MILLTILLIFAALLAIVTAFVVWRYVRLQPFQPKPFTPFDEHGHLRPDLFTPISEGGMGFYPMGLLSEDGPPKSPAKSMGEVHIIRPDEGCEQMCEAFARFYTDGHGVIRILGRPGIFTMAKTEEYQFRAREWREKPGLTAKIHFSRDWWRCTEDEADMVIGHGLLRLKEPDA